MTQKLFKLISMDEIHNFSFSYQNTNNNNNNNKLILLWVI
jgi:hypothetical protein